MGNNFDLPVNPLSGSTLEVLADDANSIDGTEQVLVVQGSTVKQTTTQAIADLGGGGSSYLVYSCFLQQTGANAPTATVLENTLGSDVTWGRSNVGIYTATVTGAAFTLQKTVPFPYGIEAATLSQNANGFLQTSIDSEEQLTVYIYEDLTLFTPIELSTITNDGVRSFYFEIRVYP